MGMSYMKAFLNKNKMKYTIEEYDYEEGLVINTPDGKNPLAIFISPSSTRKLPLKLEGEPTIWSTKEKDIDKIVQFFKYDRDQFRDTVENKIQSLVREYTDNKYLITVQEEKTDRFLHTSLFSITLRDRKTKYMIGFRFILKELLRPQIKDRIEEFLCHKKIYKIK